MRSGLRSVIRLACLRADIWKGKATPNRTKAAVKGIEAPHDKPVKEWTS
jgi:hypothetical protein